ncbi:HaeII family restriction endonuclease [Thioflexithrix psekupsensis]|uniref:Restriction endonuclease n=1 Tax=Thioflexithrix psekupsensis TaxID=1570016 RepID=A0A251X6V3_9GAMM|nr:HaeII family restriction endonuclease [Thioflexithrix psekupsensis]OUD13327.1 restriction endonuclease [Thioflexithrix psekupsensis]
MNLQQAKQSLDKVINKSRVHLYKPIQIAEILHRDRTQKDITLTDLETYRNPSKKWRDIICLQFLGRTSTSSARYQDDVFNENAIPPNVLAYLGQENRQKNGIVEAYIYRRFAARFSQMSSALAYCTEHNKNNFQLSEFLALFRAEAGLRRSIDKIYEIVIFSLFSAITEAMELSVEVSYNPEKVSILTEFQDFAENILNLSKDINRFKTKARIYRMGVTNAADKGLDMWANFGLAIQIKHLSLSEELAEDIIGSITADRIVIVCKSAEQKVIVSLLNQIGWKSKIQAIVTETDLLNWYEKALRSVHSHLLGEKILDILNQEIKIEFPTTENQEFEKFYKYRGYDKLSDEFWSV